MKTNTRRVSSDKVIESIRAGVRKEVVSAYSQWGHQEITTEDFSTWMYDIRNTSLSIIEGMGNMDVLNECEVSLLARFVQSLTEVYF